MVYPVWKIVLKFLKKQNKSRTKLILPYNPSSNTPGCLFHGNENFSSHKNLYVCVHSRSIYHHPKLENSLNVLQHIHTVGYHLVTKRNELLIHSSCMNLKAISNDKKSPKSWILHDARRSNQSFLKEIGPGCSMEGLMLKLTLQYFGHLMQRVGKDSDAGRDCGQEEKGTTEDEMAGWHHRLNGHESEWTPGVGDGQGGLACCDSWGRKESDTTERLNWTELKVSWKNFL